MIPGGKVKQKAYTLAKARKQLELRSEKESGARDLKALEIMLVFNLTAISLITITFKSYSY